jgi:hypothetical protein
VHGNRGRRIVVRKLASNSSCPANHRDLARYSIYKPSLRNAPSWDQDEAGGIVTASLSAVDPFAAVNRFRTSVVATVRLTALWI